jgi:hypothetical protein
MTVTVIVRRRPAAGAHSHAELPVDELYATAPDPEVAQAETTRRLPEG